MMIALVPGCGGPGDSGGSSDALAREVARIGSRDSLAVDSTVTFASIADLEADRHGNVFVLDRGTFRVVRISDNDSARTVLEVLRGNESGELSMPNGLEVDRFGSMYISDQIGRNISIFDSKGAFVRRIPLREQPTQFAMGADAFYVTSFWPEARQGVISRFSMDGLLELNFLKKPDEWVRIARSGSSESIAVGPDSSLYYSYPYPYRIVRFGREGQTLHVARGHPRFPEDALPVDTTAQVRVGSRGLAIGPGGIVMNLVMDDGETRFMDVFSQDLRFVRRVHAADFRLYEFRHIAVSSDGYLYLSVREPAHVRKYAVDWERLASRE